MISKNSPSFSPFGAPMFELLLDLNLRKRIISDKPIIGCIGALSSCAAMLINSSFNLLNSDVN